MFDIGLQELVLIFVIALLVFGPKNLPQLGRSLGRALREFRRASDEFRSTIETNLKINEPDPVPGPEPAAPTQVPAPVEPLPETLAADSAPVGTVVDASPAASGEAYLAQRGGRLVHGRQCGWAQKIAEADRVYFKRLAEAREAGLETCPVCDPWEAG
jgi:TatA/E family protein of Tat protein translocase